MCIIGYVFGPLSNPVFLCVAPSRGHVVASKSAKCCICHAVLGCTGCEEAGAALS
jgi:hypothetical protein